MADKNIGALSAAASVDDDSLFVAEQQGEAVKVTGAQIREFAAAAGSTETSANAAASASAAAASAAEAAVSAGNAGTSESNAAASAASAAASAAEAQAAVGTLYNIQDVTAVVLTQEELLASDLAAYDAGTLLFVEGSLS